MPGRRQPSARRHVDAAAESFGIAARQQVLVARHWQLVAQLRQAGLPLRSALDALDALTRLKGPFNSGAVYKK
jgi:hypothetical protein